VHFRARGQTEKVETEEAGKMIEVGEGRAVSKIGMETVEIVDGGGMNLAMENPRLQGLRESRALAMVHYW